MERLRIDIDALNIKRCNEDLSSNGLLFFVVFLLLMSALAWPEDKLFFKLNGQHMIILLFFWHLT